MLQAAVMFNAHTAYSAHHKPSITSSSIHTSDGIGTLLTPRVKGFVVR
jgi:hypothetical protein